MASKRRFSLTRLFRQHGPRKIGQRSLASRILAIVTLAPLRKNAGRFFKSFFQFAQPVWAASAGRLRYSPRKQLTKWDYLNPIYWCAWSVGFLYRWLISRPYLQLGPALLAIFTAALLGGLIVRQSWEGRDWRGQMYKQMLGKAIDADNEELAEICLLNLVSRYPLRTEYRLQQALLLEKQGDMAGAMSTMLGLAFDHSDGQAALWIAEKRLNLKTLEEWEEEEHAQFRQLMEIALVDRRSQIQAASRGLYSQYLIGIGAYTEAIRNLSPLAAQNPATNLTIAQLYMQLGDEANTAKYAALARDHFDKLLLAAPSDKQVRLRLAQAQLMLKDEQKAALTLSDGFKLSGNKDREFAVAGGETLAAWSMRLKATKGNTDETLASRIKLLTQAMTLAPKSEVVLEALVEVAIECSENQNDQITKLRGNLLRGIAPENLHFIEGTIALLQGETEEAKLHLDLASESGRQLPGILNNLAVALYQKDPPELERALSLSNSAIERTDHPYLRETRGQILVNMKRYQEAIPDLEAGLAAPELAPAIHKSLAEAYRALGQTKLAEQYERLVAEDTQGSS